MAKKLVVQQKKKHSIGDTLEIVDVLPVTTAKAVIEYEGDATVDHATQRKTARRFVNDDEKDAIAEIPHNVYIDDDPYPQPASGTIRNNSLDLFGIASTEMLEDKFNKIDSHLPTLGVFEVPPTTNYDHYVHVLTISPDACAEILNSTGSIKIAISGNGLRYTEIIFGTRVATLRRFNMYITDTTSYGRISAYHVDDKLKLVVKLQDPDTPTNTPLYLHSVVSTNNRATYQVEMTELEQVNFLGEIKKYTYANISSATLTSPGLMTAEDKQSLNGILDSIYYNRDIMQVATGTSLKNGNSIASAIASWLNGQETPQYDFIYKIYEQDTTQKNIATLYPIFYYNGGAEHQVEYICYSIYGVGKINIYAVQGGSPEYSYTDILPSDLYERFDNGYASIGITNGENVTLTTGDQGRIELISDSVVIETNSGYDYSPTLDKEVANKGYVDKHTLSLRKEIASLKEMTASQINLESTSVNVEDGGVVPQIVNVDGQDYNVLPKGDVSVLSVEGDSVKSENLWSGSKTLTTTISAWYIVLPGVALEVTPNTDYTIVCDAYHSVTMGRNINGPWAMLKIAVSVEPNSEIYLARGLTSGQIIANQKYKMQVTFNSGNNTRVYFRYGRSESADNSGTSTFKNIMLVKGTQAPTEFQPYFEGLKHTEYKNVTIASRNLINMVRNEFTTTRNDESRRDTFLLEVWKVKSNSNIDDKITNMTSGSKIFWNAGGYDGIAYLRYGLNGNAQDDKLWQEEPIYIKGNSSYNLSFSYVTDTGNNVVVKDVMLVEGTAPLGQYIPYYSTPILSVPTTLQGVEGHRDTLEVRLNEDTLLYDVYKVVRCKTVTLTDTNHWILYENNIWTSALDNDSLEEHTPISTSPYLAKVLATGSRTVFYTEGAHTVESWKLLVSANPITITYALATPTETLIRSNLTFEQVTALVHTLSNVKIVNPNDIYLNKPRVNLGLVYKKVIS